MDHSRGLLLLLLKFGLGWNRGKVGCVGECEANWKCKSSDRVQEIAGNTTKRIIFFFAPLSEPHAKLRRGRMSSSSLGNEWKTKSMCMVPANDLFIDCNEVKIAGCYKLLKHIIKTPRKPSGVTK